MADLEVAKVELGAWVDPVDGIHVAKVELGAWVEPVDGILVAKAELGAWLDYTGASGRRRQMIVT